MATLKEIRKLCGMTQKQLAEKSGLNIRQIQKYESGEYALKNVTTQTAVALSKALDITLEEMVNLDTSIFTSGMTTAIKSGDLALTNAVSMWKLWQVQKFSKIGSYGDTFSKNYSRIPENLLEKLPPEDLAALVDAFYKCYSEGRNHDS